MRSSPTASMQGSQRHQHLHRGAVRVGHDPAMAVERLGVDLRHDERDVVVHAPEAGVVDHDGARLDEARRPLLAHRSARRGEHEVESLDRIRRQGAALDLLARHTRASVPAERSELNGNHLGGREPTLAEHLEDRRCRLRRWRPRRRPCSRRRPWLGSHAGSVLGARRLLARARRRSRARTPRGGPARPARCRRRRSRTRS